MKINERYAELAVIWFVVGLLGSIYLKPIVVDPKPIYYSNILNNGTHHSDRTLKQYLYDLDQWYKKYYWLGLPIQDYYVYSGAITLVGTIFFVGFSVNFPKKGNKQKIE